MKQFAFECPSWGTRVESLCGKAFARLAEEGRCQGCRACVTFSANEELGPLFIGFWRQYGFPASSSWLAGYPAGDSLS